MGGGAVEVGPGKGFGRMMFNFKEATYYQVAEGAKAVPKVPSGALGGVRQTKKDQREPARIVFRRGCLKGVAMLHLRTSFCNREQA